MYQITVLTLDGKKANLQFKNNEYRNIMQLIVDQLAEDIGDCKGRGLCGTCYVKILEGELDDTPEPSEIRTLNYSQNNKPNIRLACQLMANRSVNNFVLQVLGEDE